MSTPVRILVAVGGALVLSWLALLAYVWLAVPSRSKVAEGVRLLPDTVRLLRRVAADGAAPRGIRVRLWLLFAYLAFPLDLVPDFVPVLGYADDVVIVTAVVRSVVRRAGPDLVRRHWPGTPDGLAALWRLARLPGSPVDRGDGETGG
jgi:uncharacterized membrane protein YkvA (DUF1232 family)